MFRRQKLKTLAAFEIRTRANGLFKFCYLARQGRT